MESWLPVILFLLGFVAAVKAGGLFKWNVRFGGSTKLPVDNGAIRLDRLGKGSAAGRQQPEPWDEGSANSQDAPPAPPKAAATEKRRREAARSGKRK
ncbi:MAG: hypothetical protein ACYC5J_15585 [Chloroflexota bacterium]